MPRRPFAHAPLAALLFALAAPAALPGCAQRATEPPLRSLDRSGRVALACLGLPDANTGSPGHPMIDCDGSQPSSVYDFAQGTELSGAPHVYALVTQQTRGELAVIDLSVDPLVTQSILDSDLYTPGLNFLPVGAQPVDVAASGLGAGAFVAAAEPGRPGIYALPSSQIRGPQLSPTGTATATLRSWPACSLPSAPGRMLLVPSGRPAAGEARFCAEPNLAHYAGEGDVDGDNRHCVTPGGAPVACANPPGASPGPASVNVVYEGDARPACGAVDTDGDGQPDQFVADCKPQLVPEGGQAEKLLVTLPETGELLVIDAQTLFERPPGTFDPCPIERAIALNVDAPEAPPADAPGDSCPALPAAAPAVGLCPERPVTRVSYPAQAKARPAAMAFGDGRLYIADEGAPIIHVLSLEDGCGLRELPPLLPSSYEEPGRPVYTSALAVSPTTTDLRSYVYAVDHERGSLMAFDVSVGSTDRSPLFRDRPDLKLFGARDRLSVGGPVRDVTFIEVSRPAEDAQGNLRDGVCNPDASAPDPNGGELFRTSADYTDGAGPLRLRGMFALVTLTSGVVRVVDVDDLDAACRGARVARGYAPPADDAVTDLPASLTGCESCALGAYNDTLGASGEYSCDVVQRHELRSAFYFANKSETGLHAPGFQAYPVLSFNGASLRTDASPEARANPKLLGPAAPNYYYDPNVPIPEKVDGSNWQLFSEVIYNEKGAPTPARNPNYVRYPSLDALWAFERGGGSVLGDPFPESTERNFVVPDFREPRAHADEAWTVWYEGPLPGFEGRFADSRLGASELDPAQRGFFDPDATFCDAGVHDEDATRLEAARLLGASAPADDLDSFAKEHADFVEIADDLLPPEDPYWAAAVSEARPQADRCDYYSCEATFGAATNPTAARNFIITRAYQDRVFVRDSVPRTLDPDCCFPTLVRYRVRTHNTWTVVGGTVGFLHHGTVDEATGRCVDRGVDQATGAFCDPLIALRNGRAYEALNPDVIKDKPSFSDVRWPCRDELGAVALDRRPQYDRPAEGGPPTCFPPAVTDPMTFRNGLLNFVLYRGVEPSQRDMVFTWSMTGGFVPLQIDLSRGGLVAPASAVFSPSLQRLIVTDGGQNGVFSLNLFTFGFRSYL
jgi:hypothetical protein